jgi:hypothetical protein
VRSRDRQRADPEVLAVAGDRAGQIGRPPDAERGALEPSSKVSTSERLTRNVVISMTANQPRALRAVRRAARALSSVNDQQVAMWEAYWRAGRFPPK